MVYVNYTQLYSKFPEMTHIESNFTLIYKITVPASIFIITHQGVGFFLGRLPGPESTPSPVNVKLHQLSPGPPWKHQPNEVRNPPINLHINHHKHESFLVILSIRNLYNIYIYIHIIKYHFGQVL